MKSEYPLIIYLAWSREKLETFYLYCHKDYGHLSFQGGEFP